MSVASATRHETGSEGEDFNCVEPSLGFFAIATVFDDGGWWVAARASLRACRQSLAETGGHSAPGRPKGRFASLEAGRQRLEEALRAAQGTTSVWEDGPRVAPGGVLFDETMAWAASARECGVYMARAGQISHIGRNSVPEAIDVRTGDRWLLCSAGVRDVLSADRIAEVLGTGGREHRTLDGRVNALAAARGEKVTATLVLMEILGAS